MPEQNGDALTDVAALESAIAKQVFRCHKMVFLFSSDLAQFAARRDFRATLCEN